MRFRVKDQEDGTSTVELTSDQGWSINRRIFQTNGSMIKKKWKNRNATLSHPNVLAKAGTITKIYRLHWVKYLQVTMP